MSESLIEGIFPLGSLREGERIDPGTGLVTCTRCGTPRQKNLEVMGQTMTVRCLCRCQAEERERLDRIHRAREGRDRIQRMRSVGLPDRQMRHCTFDHDLGISQGMDHARRYVEHWEEMEAQGMGLLIYGGVGTGKSFMSACIANALLDRGISVLMTNFSRLLNGLPAGYSEEKNERLDQLNRCRLLILDDFGAERGTEYALEQIHSFVDARVQSGRPMIVTTNLSLKEMQAPDCQAKARIYSRVLQRCMPLLVDGRDLRGVEARENLRKVKGILKGQGSPD